MQYPHLSFVVYMLKGKLQKILEEIKTGTSNVENEDVAIHHNDEVLIILLRPLMGTLHNSIISMHLIKCIDGVIISIWGYFLTA